MLHSRVQVPVSAPCACSVLTASTTGFHPVSEGSNPSTHSKPRRRRRRVAPGCKPDVPDLGGSNPSLGTKLL